MYGEVTSNASSSQTCRQAGSAQSTFPSWVCNSKQLVTTAAEARTGACINTRCVPIIFTSARWPITAGSSGLWSSWERGNAIFGRAPLAIVEQTNVQPAERISLPVRQVDAFVLSSSDLSGPSSFDSLGVREFSDGEWK
jgi:hypothetical protein